jgi:hypothetical protein
VLVSRSTPSSLRMPALSLHQSQDPLIPDSSAYSLHQRGVRDFVEEGSDVEIDHPVPSPAALPTNAHCFQRRSPRSVAIGVGVEQRLHLRLQVQACDRLSDALSHSRHAKDPDRALPVLLRYFDRPYRRRKITS